MPVVTTGTGGIGGYQCPYQIASAGTTLDIIENGDEGSARVVFNLVRTKKVENISSFYHLAGAFYIGSNLCFTTGSKYTGCMSPSNYLFYCENDYINKEEGSIFNLEEMFVRYSGYRRFKLSNPTNIADVTYLTVADCLTDWKLISSYGDVDKIERTKTVDEVDDDGNETGEQIQSTSIKTRQRQQLVREREFIDLSSFITGAGLVWYGSQIAFDMGNGKTLNAIPSNDKYTLMSDEYTFNGDGSGVHTQTWEWYGKY